MRIWCSASYFHSHALWLFWRWKTWGIYAGRFHWWSIFFHQVSTLGFLVIWLKSLSTDKVVQDIRQWSVGLEPGDLGHSTIAHRWELRRTASRWNAQVNDGENTRWYKSLGVWCGASSPVSLPMFGTLISNLRACWPEIYLSSLFQRRWSKFAFLDIPDGTDESGPTMYWQALPLENPSEVVGVSRTI